MRHALAAAAAALLLTTLAACDFVRFPGDGGPPPSLPEEPEPIPPGAPGPPPPDVDDSEFEEPVETPVEDPPVDPVPETPGDEPVTDPVDAETPGETATPPVDVPVEEPPVDDPVTPPETEPEVPVEEPPPPVEPVFSYYQPGALLPGSGGGFPDQMVHAPDMLFPVKSAPAVLQSQVFAFGGGVAGGDQCDARNYEAPWRDNFCETRSANRTTPFCPVAKIHQGQDIRVGTAADCRTLRSQSPSQRGLHEVIAVEDGVISSITTYNVKLRAEGSIYNYMHLNMNRLAVTAGQNVQAGDLIGYVSNDFGGTPTTIHLHFEILQNTASNSWVHVPPYLSLVAAYERRENGPGQQLEPEIGVASAEVFVIPEGMEIIE